MAQSRGSCARVLISAAACKWELQPVLGPRVAAAIWETGLLLRPSDRAADCGGARARDYSSGHIDEMDAGAGWTGNGLIGPRSLAFIQGGLHVHPCKWAPEFDEGGHGHTFDDIRL
jgi:hypothetical protein